MIAGWRLRRHTAEWKSLTLGIGRRNERYIFVCVCVHVHAYEFVCVCMHLCVISFVVLLFLLHYGLKNQISSRA